MCYQETDKHTRGLLWAAVIAVVQEGISCNNSLPNITWNLSHVLSQAPKVFGLPNWADSCYFTLLHDLHPSISEGNNSLQLLKAFCGNPITAKSPRGYKRFRTMTAGLHLQTTDGQYFTKEMTEACTQIKPQVRSSTREKTQSSNGTWEDSSPRAETTTEDTYPAQLNKLPNCLIFREWRVVLLAGTNLTS